jgi:hypothetical protein
VADSQELHRLLTGLRPELHAEPYVYALGPAPAGTPGTRVFATVAEDEGLTLVLTRDEAAAAGLRPEWAAARITLRIDSKLTDVGLTATVSSRLASHGIPCNVVAGLAHDHLFVPEDRAGDALELLRLLVREATSA